MKNARIYLEKFIKSTTFYDTKIPIYQNVFPYKTFKSEVIKNNLIKQLDSKVLWLQTIKSIQHVVLYRKKIDKHIRYD